MQGEIRRLRFELSQKHANEEELREELNQLTRKFLVCKQDRDRFYAQIQNIKGDLQNIDAVIKKNVD